MSRHTDLMIEYQEETEIDALSGWDGSIELEYVWWLESKVEELRGEENSSTKEDTLEHINKVKKNILRVTEELTKRGEEHDASKLESPEKEIFDREGPLLNSLSYGSDEYKESLKRLGEALQHHYENNRHHPEHHDNGISGMNLIDIVEMVCDWMAASERHFDGNIYRSLVINKERFEISDQLYDVILNTVNYLVLSMELLSSVGEK